MKKTTTRNRKKKIGVASALCVCVLCALGAAIAAHYRNTRQQKAVENPFVPAKIRLAVQEDAGTPGVGAPEDADSENTAERLIKEFPWTSSAGEANASAVKRVRILNVNSEDENNAAAYIRLCIVPRWVTVIAVSAADDGEAPVTQDVDVTTYYLGEAEDGSPLFLSDFGKLTDVGQIPGTVYSLGDLTLTLDGAWADSWIFNPTDGWFYYRRPVQPGTATEWLLESVSLPQELLDAAEAAGISLRLDILADSIQTEADALGERWGAPETLGIAIGADGSLRLTSAPEENEGGAAGG